MIPLALKKNTIIIFLCLFSSLCLAQGTSIRYYKDKYCDNETTPGKANYQKTVTDNPDGTNSTIVKDLNRNKVIRSETYKGEEPFGIWIYDGGDLQLDYNFDLNYSPKKCSNSDTTLKVRDYFTNMDSIQYVAPKLTSGEANLFKFLIKNVQYPPIARESGIGGKVFVSMVFTENGTIEDIAIVKGAHILLDKETVRILRSVKLDGPATYKGQKIRFCFNFPFSYKIQ